MDHVDSQPSKMGVFMPLASQTGPKRLSSTTPYAQTGVASRDSYRKQFYDNLSSRFQEESSNHPVPTWTESLEEELFVRCRSEVSREYREKANLLIRSLKNREKIGLVQCLANIETGLQTLLTLSQPSNTTKVPAPKSLSAAPKPPVVRPPQLPKLETVKRTVPDVTTDDEKAKQEPKGGESPVQAQSQPQQETATQSERSPKDGAHVSHEEKKTEPTEERTVAVANSTEEQSAEKPKSVQEEERKVAMPLVAKTEEKKMHGPEVPLLFSKPEQVAKKGEAEEQKKPAPELRRGETQRTYRNMAKHTYSISGRNDTWATLQNQYRDVRHELEAKKRKMYTTNNELNYCMTKSQLLDEEAKKNRRAADEAEKRLAELRTKLGGLSDDVSGQSLEEAREKHDGLQKELQELKKIHAKCREAKKVQTSAHKRLLSECKFDLEKLRLEILALYQQRSAVKVDCKCNVEGLKTEIANLGQELKEVAEQIERTKTSCEEMGREEIKEREEKSKLEKDIAELSESNKALREEVLKMKAKYQEELSSVGQQTVSNTKTNFLSTSKPVVKSLPKGVSAEPVQQLNWGEDDFFSGNFVEPMNGHQSAKHGANPFESKKVVANGTNKGKIGLVATKGVFIPKSKAQCIWFKVLRARLSVKYQEYTLKNSNASGSQSAMGVTVAYSQRQLIFALQQQMHPISLPETTAKLRPRSIRALCDHPVLSDEAMHKALGSPRAGARKVGRMEIGIEQQFNKMWLHLYRNLKDIQGRRLRSCDPMVLQAREALTAYALKTGRALAVRSRYMNEVAEGLEAEQDDQELRMAEAEGRRVDPTLEKVVFLEEIRPQFRGTNVYSNGEPSRLQSKYRRWVLEACGLTSGAAMVPKARASVTKLHSYSPRHRSSRRELPTICSTVRPSAKDVTSAVSVSPRPELTARDITRAFTLSIDATAAGPLIQSRRRCESVSTEEVERKPKVKTKTKQGRLKEVIEEFTTPEKVSSTDLFSAETMSVLNLTPEYLLTKDGEREKYKTPILNAGNSTKSTPKLAEAVPDSTLPILQTPSIATVSPIRVPESYEKLERERAVRATMQAFTRQIYGKRRRFLSPQPIVNNGSNINTSPKKKSIRRVKLRPKPAMSSRIRPKAPFVTGIDQSIGSTFNTSAFPERRTNSTLEDTRNSNIASIMNKCVEAQKKAAKDLHAVSRAGRRIGRQLRRIDGLIGGKAELTVEKEAERYAKSIKKNKHLFIYGKGGLGRFLSEEGKDLVRMSDQLVKLDTKYEFMENRLSDVLNSRTQE